MIFVALVKMHIKCYGRLTWVSQLVSCPWIRLGLEIGWF